jgi:undecaprenyl pyrophosphate phosphatase UppP
VSLAKKPDRCHARKCSGSGNLAGTWRYNPSFVDKWFNKESADQEITYPKALKIGFFQIISMIPGVSRSAATIIGGLSQS